MGSTGIVLRGMAMGAADIVPGVSGGTVAFITGIYPQLLASIKSFDLSVLKFFLRGDFGAVWRIVDGHFLLPLVLGIGFSIFIFSQLLVWLLLNFSLLLWSCFFGLVLASALILLSRIEQWVWQHKFSLLVGVCLAIYITSMPAVQVQVPAPIWVVFFSGSLAICAMILPGISGSFILLLLGMYSPVLMAIKQLDVLFLAVFISGCILGLLSFTRLLHWLLERYANVTMSLLTGFLIGSLMAVWPWKKTVSYYIDRQGELKPLQQMVVSPGEFLLSTGIEPNVWLCCGLMLLGFCLVLLLEFKIRIPES
jgi:putative membrane protein